MKPLIFSFVLFSSSATAQGLVDFCNRALKSSFGSQPTESAALSYGQPVVRDLFNLDNMFAGDEFNQLQIADGNFTEFHKTLKPGEVVLDIGGGMAISALQIAQKYSAATTSISVIDFEPKFRLGLREIKAKNVRFEHGFIASVGVLTWKEIVTMGRVLGIKFPANDSYYSLHWPNAPIEKTIADHAKVIVGQYVSLRKTLIKMGLLTLETGTAEGVLEKRKYNAKLIYDVYGAMFYSIHRAWLAYQYYNQLKTGGRAYVLLGKHNDTDFEGVRAYDFVNLKNGRGRVELFKFLSQKYPNIFHLRTTYGMNSFDFLEIRKIPNIPQLNYDLPMDSSEVQIYSGSTSFVYPTGVLYREL